jgi:acetylornithine deacetylase/succinyl-diaminopimelate desuccinylase-like protein
MSERSSNLFLVCFFSIMLSESALAHETQIPLARADNQISTTVFAPEDRMKLDSKPGTVDSFVQSMRTNYEDDLKGFVDVPSVSADPSHKKDILAMAKRAEDLLKKFGAEAETIPTNGNPIVYGLFRSATSNPTVLVYNHLDVQPADAVDWMHPPFEMNVDGGTYRGRGTTDDKGPALAILYAAKYIHDNNIPINVKFIWELEEEIGSPSFENALSSNRARFAADSIVVSDTIWLSREQPAISYGLRGLQGATIKLTTGSKDVHSGTTGGLARNPIGELCQLIDQCYDAKTGRVKIPGFYDHVRKLDPEEVHHFVNSGFNLAEFRKAHALFSLRTNDVEDAAQRIWAQPTFEVHGIVGGYTGPGIKTIVPHFAEAKVSMRLVPDQEPARVFELLKEFVKDKCPDAVVSPEASLRPYLTNFTGMYYQVAGRSMEKTFGKKPAFTREGGSIGAVVSMHDILNSPIVFLGLSLPEHGYHAVNENFDWQQAGGGIRLFIDYFTALSNIKAGT